METHLKDLRYKSYQEHHMAHNAIQEILDILAHKFNDTEIEILLWLSKIQAMKAEEIKVLIQMWTWESQMSLDL